MANLKSTTINDTGFLQLPSGTTAQRPQSPTAGEIRFNTDMKVCEWYDSELDSWFPTGVVPPIATGGDTVQDVDINGVTYRIHSFTTVGSSTFTVSRGGLVDYLVVAGGGGGGSGVAGGGGAGGVLTGQILLKDENYSVFVGSGGVKGIPGSYPGSGNNSSFNVFTSIGGGASSETDSALSPRSGQPGGSGGGGSRYNSGTIVDPGQGTPDQGNNGGNYGGVSDGAGGGGGAGEPGRQGPNGNGGQGISSQLTGSPQFYGGGGGGSGDNSGTPGIGGLGGGSDGVDGGGLSALPADPNTGGGGGGSRTYKDGDGGAGGSGIVIIRYRIS